MKWSKSMIAAALLFAAAAGFSMIKLLDASYIRSQYTSVSIRFTKEKVTEDFLENALANEKNNGSASIPEITAWLQQDQTKINNADLGRSATVRVIIAAGDMSVTAPMTLLQGSFVYQGDKSGCMIDTDTAYKLYGTRNVTGNSLNYHNRNYIIRGVVSSPGRLMLLQGDGVFVEYSNLEIIYPDAEQGEALAESFLLKNGFPEDYAVLDGCIDGKLLSTLLGLPVWLFFIGSCILILHSLWKKRPLLKVNRFAIYSLISILIILGYGMLLYRFTKNPFYIPEKFIPTRFSDFDYWTKQYQQVKEQLSRMRYLTPNLKDVFLENAFIKLSLDFTLMIVLYATFLLYVILSVRNMKNKIREE